MPFFLRLSTTAYLLIRVATEHWQRGTSAGSWEEYAKQIAVTLAEYQLVEKAEPKNALYAINVGTVLSRLGPRFARWDAWHMHPLVELSQKVYQKGVALSKGAMRAVEARLARHSGLPQRDILIHPVSTS